MKWFAESQFLTGVEGRFGRVFLAAFEQLISRRRGICQAGTEPSGLSPQEVEGVWGRLLWGGSQRLTFRFPERVLLSDLFYLSFSASGQLTCLHGFLSKCDGPEGCLC